MPEVSLESPYAGIANPVMMRGNLHVHTVRSDGKVSPQETIDVYADMGYDFLALSDHDVHGDVDGLDPRGMILLIANEVSAGGSHLLHVDGSSRVHPHPKRQKVLDAIGDDTGFAILCHPNWNEELNHYTTQNMLTFEGYTGIEIFNGLVLDQPGNHLAADKWDILLTAGKMVWGYANDDAHNPMQTGRGWNVVLARERSERAVLEALRAGCFYASTGVMVESITCDGPELYVKTADADVIMVFGENGVRKHHVEGSELRFDASGILDSYIRVECHGRGLAAAWLQPMRIMGGPAEDRRLRIEALRSREKPVLHVLHALAEPVMTGRMDDPAWGKAEVTEGFVLMADASEATVKTEVSCIAAGDKIVVGIRCEEPKVDALRLSGRADGDPNLWSDDSVELFFDVAGNGRSYVQVIVNAEGKIFAMLPQTGETLDAQATTKAAISADGWTAEVAIPLDALGASVKPGSRWGFHVCRNRYPENGTHMWTWVGKSNHNPALYGSLVF